MSSPKNLLYCWVASEFHVLVPKARGEGFLRVPYGHLHNADLDAIGALVGLDILGLEGSLHFETDLAIYCGGPKAREAFEAKVMPALENLYGWGSREIAPSEFWELLPAERRRAA